MSLEEDDDSAANERDSLKPRYDLYPNQILQLDTGRKVKIDDRLRTVEGKYGAIYLGKEVFGRGGKQEGAEVVVKVVKDDDLGLGKEGTFENTVTKSVNAKYPKDKVTARYLGAIHLDRHVFMALEKIQGKTLQARLDELATERRNAGDRRSVTRKQWKLLHKGLRILQKLHQMHVLHKDAHLNNFLVTENDEKVLIIDFGMAVSRKLNNESYLKETMFYLQSFARACQNVSTEAYLKWCVRKAYALRGNADTDPDPARTESDIVRHVPEEMDVIQRTRHYLGKAYVALDRMNGAEVVSAIGRDVDAKIVCMFYFMEHVFNNKVSNGVETFENWENTFTHVFGRDLRWEDYTMPLEKHLVFQEHLANGVVIVDYPFLVLLRNYLESDVNDDISRIVLRCFLFLFANTNISLGTRYRRCFDINKNKWKTTSFKFEIQSYASKWVKDGMKKRTLLLDELEGYEQDLERDRAEESERKRTRQDSSSSFARNIFKDLEE